MPLGDKAKAAWPLRAATLKQQAMITRRGGKRRAASGKRQAGLKSALRSVHTTKGYPIYLNSSTMQYALGQQKQTKILRVYVF